MLSLFICFPRFPACNISPFANFSDQWRDQSLFSLTNFFLGWTRNLLFSSWFTFFVIIKMIMLRSEPGPCQTVLPVMWTGVHPSFTVSLAGLPMRNYGASLDAAVEEICKAPPLFACWPAFLRRQRLCARVVCVIFLLLLNKLSLFQSNLTNLSRYIS